jgi:hypothetical protein
VRAIFGLRSATSFLGNDDAADFYLLRATVSPDRLCELEAAVANPVAPVHFFRAKNLEKHREVAGQTPCFLIELAEEEVSMVCCCPARNS